MYNDQNLKNVSKGFRLSRASYTERAIAVTAWLVISTAKYSQNKEFITFAKLYLLLVFKKKKNLCWMLSFSKDIGIRLFTSDT